MASVAFVTSNQVLQINETPLFDGCFATVQIPCAQVVPQGLAWAVPLLNVGGIQTGWTFSLESTAPSTDSVRVQRLWNKENDVTYWVAVDDSATEAVFVDRCNACCGATPVMPTVTIPAILSQECPCANDDGDFEYFIPFPENPNTLDYLLSGTFNGVAGTPSPAAGGYSSKANLLTFANTATTGWAAYGTWSLVGTGDSTLKLASSTVECAQIGIALETVSYCFQIPSTSTEVNGIRIGATPVDVEFPNIFFDDTSAANRQAIIDAISPYLIGDLEIVTDSGDYFVKYTGVQKPVRLNLDGAAVSGTTFATGTCP